MNPSRNSITYHMYGETLALPLTPNMMKHFVISALALLTLLSSCTPARQVAQSTPSKASVPAFQTWVDTSEAPAESLAQESTLAPESQEKESLEASYARFRKDNPTEIRKTNETVTGNKNSTPAPAPPKSVLRTSPAQPQAMTNQEDADVIQVYIDSKKPVVVKLIEGSPEGIKIIRELEVTPKEVKYEYPHMKSEKVESPQKPTPAVLKNAPYVQKRPQKSAETQDFMMEMMEEELTEAKEAIALTRDGQVAEELPAQIKKILEPQSVNTHLISVDVASGREVVIDENLLRQWEKKIVDARMGIESDVRLPRWLLQGLEWVTHAGKAEPKRSESIMPLYRQLEARGHLEGINLNQMTPVQVVRKIRILVDELKANKGQLSMN